MTERRQRHVRYTAALLFGVAAIVQFNDPDPVRWVLCYAGAALLLIFTERSAPPGRRQMLRLGCLALACISGLWALSLWLEHRDVMEGALRDGKLLDSVSSMSNQRPENELYKELGGLLIVCGVLIWNSTAINANTNIKANTAA